jgi:hypothetical protein
VNTLESTSFNGLQWILTKLGTNLVLKRIWNPIEFQGQGDRVKYLPRNILVNTLESTSFNGLQWILTKLGTYLVLKRIWNPIDFQGQMSRSPGQMFRQGDMPRFALPLLILVELLTVTWPLLFKLSLSERWLFILLILVEFMTVSWPLLFKLSIHNHQRLI